MLGRRNGYPSFFLFFLSLASSHCTRCSNLKTQRARRVRGGRRGKDWSSAETVYPSFFLFFLSLASSARGAQILKRRGRGGFAEGAEVKIARAPKRLPELLSVFPFFGQVCTRCSNLKTQRARRVRGGRRGKDCSGAETVTRASFCFSFLWPVHTARGAQILKRRGRGGFAEGAEVKIARAPKRLPELLSVFPFFGQFTLHEVLKSRIAGMAAS